MPAFLKLFLMAGKLDIFPGFAKLIDDISVMVSFFLFFRIAVTFCSLSLSVDWMVLLQR